MIFFFHIAAYGTVVEMRINTKGITGKLPNFGFVVFDDSDPVQKILGAKVDGACIDISLPPFTHWVVLRFRSIILNPWSAQLVLNAKNKNKLMYLC